MRSFATILSQRGQDISLRGHAFSLLYIPSLYSDKLYLLTVSTLLLAKNTGRGIPVDNSNFIQFTKYGARGSRRIKIHINW